MSDGGQSMKTAFNQAANDSPRSGSDKKVSPFLWASIVAIALVIALWLVMHG